VEKIRRGRLVAADVGNSITRKLQGMDRAERRALLLRQAMFTRLWRPQRRYIEAPAATEASMTDVLGWRKVFAVIGPSTNTVVQPDMEAMRPPGVTNQYRDIYAEDPAALSDAAFLAGTTKFIEGAKVSLRAAITCHPDHIVIGISVISFTGGLAGATALRDELAALAGVGVSVGSLSLAAGLRAYGSVKRLALLTPYYPAANAQVSRFLDDCGYTVVRDVALRCPSWTAIAKVPEAQLLQVLRELDGDDVDAIVQVGTNLSMVRLAAEAERWLGKPVVAINAATYWHALRAVGINDRMAGLGRLLAEM
jgi:maleate isomerase